MSISGHIKIHIVDTMLVKYAIYLKNKKTVYIWPEIENEYFNYGHNFFFKLNFGR